MENLCTVGTMCESECNLITYSKTVGYDLLLEMGPDSREILMWITITMQRFVFTTRMPSSNSILCNKEMLQPNWFALLYKERYFLYLDICYT